MRLRALRRTRTEAGADSLVCGEGAISGVWPHDAPCQDRREGADSKFGPKGGG